MFGYKKSVYIAGGLLAKVGCKFIFRVFIISPSVDCVCL